MASPSQASLPTVNGSLNRAADTQKVTALTANVVEQITAGNIIDYHRIAEWRTQQDEPGFERNPATSWLATVGHLVLCMEPELSRPTVLLYISTGHGIKYALTLTNKLQLVQFKMQDITNRTDLVAPNKGHLKGSGAFHPSSKSRGIKPTSVPHLFPLAVKDVAHLLATKQFPNELQKQGMVPMLTTDTCHWLRFTATQSTTSNTSSRLATKFTTITSLSAKIRTRIVDDIREVGQQDKLLEFVEACGVLPSAPIPTSGGLLHVPEATTMDQSRTVTFNLNSATPKQTEKHHPVEAITRDLYTQLMATPEADDITTMTTDLELKLRSAAAILTSPARPGPQLVDLTQPEPVPSPEQVLPPSPVPPSQQNRDLALQHPFSDPYHRANPALRTVSTTALALPPTAPAQQPTNQLTTTMQNFLNNMYATRQLTEDQKILLPITAAYLNSTSIDISQRTTTPLSQTQSAQEYDFQQLQADLVVYAGGDGAVLTRNNGLFQNLYSVGPSKENKQIIINTFCHNLVQNHPVFRNIVHTELKTTLLKGTFAPGDSNIIKSHKGLGPLAMLAQPTNVFSQLAQVVADQAWASTTTTSDHGKRKLGVAKLPDNPAETIALAQTQATILTLLFGPKCPLAQFLHKATRALTTLSQNYTGTDWVNEVGNTFIHECSNAATKFFEHKVVVSNFINHSPLEDFHDYLKTLKSGRLQSNSTLPAFLQPRTKPPPTVPFVPPQEAGGNA